jgi:arachidonate 15-lipoxygenase
MSRPVLPQNDPNVSARVDALTAARGLYAFTYDKYPFLAMLAKLPESEAAPKAWSSLVNSILVDVVKNDWRGDRVLGPQTTSWSQRLTELKLAVTNLVTGEFARSANDFIALLLAGDMGGTARSLADFSTLFQTLPLPALAHTFQDDAVFARKMVACADPEILERARALDPAFPFTDAQIAAVSSGDTVATALADGRLYVADYFMLADLVPNTLGGQNRWVEAPRVAFVVPPGGGALRVFAIQLGRALPGPENPIFTPADGWGWTLAKTHVSVADTIAGAIYFHHARTHLVGEPICVSMHRQLATNHPLFVLLAPHFEGTLSINSVGYDTVFAPDGILDWFTGATRDSIREMALTSVRTFRFDDAIFPRRLRGPLLRHRRRPRRRPRAPGLDPRAARARRRRPAGPRRSRRHPHPRLPRRLPHPGDLLRLRHPRRDEFPCHRRDVFRPQ